MYIFIGFEVEYNLLHPVDLSSCDRGFKVAFSTLHFKTGLWSRTFDRSPTSPHKMSVEEGLKSTDVEIVKSARGSAKGKVSKYVKALGNVLLRDGKTFLLEEIDQDRAEKVYDSLNTSYEEFQELHDRYHRYAEESLDEEVETKYLSEVDKAYSGAVKLYAGYKKSQKLSLRKTKMKLLESKISSLKESEKR